jgi:hypothetical protein
MATAATRTVPFHHSSPFQQRMRLRVMSALLVLNAYILVRIEETHYEESGSAVTGLWGASRSVISWAGKVASRRAAR